MRKFFSLRHFISLISLILFVFLIAGCDGFSPGPDVYTVTYHGNGNTGGTVPIDNNTYEAGSQVTIRGNTGNLEKIGYTFEGWNTENDQSGTDYAPGEVMLMPESNVILYAKWVEVIYQIGDTGPAGGTVFYDKGSYSNGWRYLEAAPSDTEWEAKVWGGYDTFVGETETDIGTGIENTNAIVDEYEDAEPHENKSDYAAKLCFDFTNGGFNDWFLPSKDELNELYLQQDIVGGFSEHDYWSSSEINAFTAWRQKFGNGHQASSYKDNLKRVRAIRAF
jgi:uncharacterized repeat protein (TIGR02543 family)